MLTLPTAAFTSVPDPHRSIRLCGKGDHELSRTQLERAHNSRDRVDSVTSGQFSSPHNDLPRPHAIKPPSPGQFRSSRAARSRGMVVSHAHGTRKLTRCKRVSPSGSNG